MTELRQHADPNVCVMIVGNKTDLRPQRTVLHEEGRAFAGKSCLSDFICLKLSYLGPNRTILMKGILHKSSNKKYHIGDVMVILLASNVVDRGFPCNGYLTCL